MELNIPFSAFFLLFGACQGVLLALFMFFGVKNNHLANRLLGVLLIAVSASIIIPELVLNFPPVFIHLLGINAPIMLVFGPVIYLYVLLKSNATGKISWQHMLHFIPSVLSACLLIPFFVQTSETKLALYFSWASEGLPNLIIAGWLIETIHIIIYLVLASLLILKFNRKLKRQHSNIEHINLQWLFKLLIANELIWWAYAVTFMLYVLNFSQAHLQTSYYLFSYLTSGLVYVIGYQALRHPSTYEQKSIGQKYQKSGLDGRTKDFYHKKVNDIMLEKHPYRNSDLSLNHLASIIEIHPNHLSQLINESFGKNFFDFVNTYRVEEAKSLLKNISKNSTIIEVAYIVGFNTKSTFNAAFKKWAGMTPSVFKKQALLDRDHPINSQKKASS